MHTGQPLTERTQTMIDGYVTNWQMQDSGYKIYHFNYHSQTATTTLSAFIWNTHTHIHGHFWSRTYGNSNDWNQIQIHTHICTYSVAAAAAAVNFKAMCVCISIEFALYKLSNRSICVSGWNEIFARSAWSNGKPACIYACACECVFGLCTIKCGLVLVFWFHTIAHPLTHQLKWANNTNAARF